MSNKFETNMAEIGRFLDRLLVNINEQIKITIGTAVTSDRAAAEMEAEIARLYKRIGELTESREFWKRETERLATEVCRLRESQKPAPQRTMDYLNGQRQG